MKHVFNCLLAYWRRHKLQCAIALFGVALGVAVVTAMDLANASALGSFRQSVASVTGKATHQIVPAEGFCSTGVPENLFAAIARVPGVQAAAPKIESSGLLLAKPDQVISNSPQEESAADKSHIAVVRIVGIEPFSDAPFRSIDGVSAKFSDTKFYDWLARGDQCVLPHLMAQRLGVAAGDTVAIVQSGQRHVLQVSAIYEIKDKFARGSDDIVLMDIAAAQEHFGTPGQINSIDLILPEGKEGESTDARIRELLPKGVVLQRPSERAGRVEALLDAFELNLSALSLLALVVGVFLIHNTLTVAVLQRIPIIGTLRCLGVSAREMRRAVLLEALLLGGIGSLLGLLAGTAMAGLFLSSVGGIVSDLYTHIGAFSIFYDPRALLKGAALGVAASLAGAWFPSREAGAIMPVQVLRRSGAERRAQGRWRALAAIGLGAFLAACALALLPGRSPAPGLGAAFCIAVGGALLSPAITRACSLHASRPMHALFGETGSLAARGIGANLSRSGLAVGALSLALSMTIGVAMMVASFRDTLDHWMDQALQADIYIRPAGPSLLRHHTFVSDDLLESLRRRPEVQAVDTYRGTELTLSDGSQVLVNGVDMKVTFSRGSARFPFAVGNPHRALAEMLDHDAVLISESHARKHDLKVGDSMTIPGIKGEMPVTITGIYYEYATDRGVISMNAATYAKLFGDSRANSAALYLKPGFDAEQERETLRREIGVTGGLYIFSNRTLRDEAFTVFDRTFTITGQLENLSLAVGLCGILSALLAVLRERSAEFALLRALGMTARGLFSLMLLEGALLGTVAFGIACVLGPALALLLIHVINVRAFGWTLAFSVHYDVFARVGVMALLMSAIAGLYPSWRGGKLNVVGALREE